MEEHDDLHNVILNFAAIIANCVSNFILNSTPALIQLQLCIINQ